ncbi:MAG: hypothetical protein JNM71_10025 [Flavobacterium lindanitolerans]|uniref:hypothetical protein n=1 Tax=Flavobacterium lindanitolerans TaxID=428988 RepID=UPI001A428740|nr:hypothetical protein [Flavobacterium lindanitolerans]MBL7868347.1 hypothetical protein [Flavobacterium lindanitolerans]
MNPSEKYVLTLNEEQLRDYFKVHLDCPLPIKPGERYYLLQEELLELWKNVCGIHERDVETKYIFDDDDERDFQLSEDGYNELKPLAINLSYWIEQAKNEFLDRSKSITSIMANSNIYKKHFPHKKMDINDLKKLAIKKDAGYFFHNISSMELDNILIKTIKPFFKQIIESETIRYGVKCNKQMGVTDKGNSSQYILIEINKSSAISHAYPCSEEKAKYCQTSKGNIGNNEDDKRNSEQKKETKLYYEL